MCWCESCSHTCICCSLEGLLPPKVETLEEQAERCAMLEISVHNCILSTAHL